MHVTDHSHERMIFQQIHLGGDRNFCYLIGDPGSGSAAAVDPGFEPERFVEIAVEEGLRIEAVLITHGHADHTGGVAEMTAATGATIWAGPDDAVAGARPATDGHVVELGKLRVRCLATPGHSPGHTCYLVEDRLITGDLLFCGKVGGTGSYFPGSSAEAEWKSLQKLMELPGETMVFPGHDYYGGEGAMPHSTLEHEKNHNPFLTAGDFEAFCYLKENWGAYKKEHGIR